MIVPLSQWLWLPSFGMAITFLLLLFPDGHLPSPRWRWFARVHGRRLVLDLARHRALARRDRRVAGVTQRRSAVAARSSSWSRSPGSPSRSSPSAASSDHPAAAAAGAERAQIKWLVTAATIVASFYAFILVVSLLSTNGSAPWVLFLQNMTIVMFGLIPIAIGISVLRYRLFDIDLVIRKAVLIGLMAGFITVGIPGDRRRRRGRVRRADVESDHVRRRRVLRRAGAFSRSGAGRDASPTAWSTASAPRRTRCWPSSGTSSRGAVRRRRRPAADGARAGAEALGAERARVWLGSRRMLGVSPRPGPHADAPDADGRSRRAARRATRARSSARLSVAMPANDPMDPAKEKLVADLAAQAGLVLRNVGLTEALRPRLDDLQAAQKRLVTAQDQERRTTRAQHPRRRAAAAGGAERQGCAWRRRCSSAIPARADADARANRRTTRRRRSRTSGTWRAASTRRCWRTRACSPRWKRRRASRRVPVDGRRRRRRALRPGRRGGRLLLVPGGAAERREVRARERRADRSARGRRPTWRSVCATTARASIRRRSATGRACRGSPIASARSTARCRS